MKRGNLRFIPLQADLCLNKQKVDIEDFKGWQKCNAPVYGGCLSPLYKKEGDHHDIYVGNDYYDWSDGVLSKNGTAVLSGAGSKKIKKTKTSFDYSAMAISEDDVLTWVKETSSNAFSYSIHGRTSESVTIPNCTRIVSTKAFESHAKLMYGVVVWYLHTSGSYGYCLIWEDNGVEHISYGEDNPTLWSTFNVVSPLIQVGVFEEHKFLVSFFGTSGVNLGSTQVRNVYVENNVVYDNPQFKDLSNYPTRYELLNKTAGVSVEITTKSAVYGPDKSYSDSNTNREFALGCRQKVKITVAPHSTKITVRLDAGAEVDKFEFPASGVTVVYERTLSCWGYGDDLDNQRYREQLTVKGNGVDLITPVDRYVSTQQLLPVKIPSDTYDVHFNTGNNYAILPCYNTPNYPVLFEMLIWVEKVSNPNDNSTPPTYSNEYIGGGNSGITLKNYCFPSYLMPDNNTIWSNADANTYLDMTPGITCATVNNYNTNAGNLTNFIYSGSFKYYYRSGLQSSSYATVGTRRAWFNTGVLNILASGADAAYYNFNNGTRTISYTDKQAYTESGLKDVDCCMNDARLYCVGALTEDTENPLPTKLFGLAGVFDAFDTENKLITYTSSAKFDIAYDQDNQNVFPKYYVGESISLTNNYLRIVYLFKAKKDDTKYINILIDSLSLGEGRKASYLMAGVQSGDKSNLQGGVKNTTETQGWRLLFNNNMMSNVACYEKKDYIGTILTDWFTIDDTFCPTFNTDTLYYKDNSNVIWKLELVTNDAQWDYRFIENRYIVLNTTNYFNCYDTKTGQSRHWASDYNNRIMYGYAFEDYVNNDLFKGILTSPMFSGLIITGQNANYEVTNDTITGLELGAVIYEQCLKDQKSFVSCATPYGAYESIDFYTADEGSTSALYVCSYSNGMKFINNDLVNPFATYPIPSNGDVRYNPNLFTEFIKSYNNKDMVISDGIAYRLLYFNNVVPIMSYYMLDGVEELLSAFVLQTTYYGVSPTRLYQMSYNDGASVEVVADITNLEYLGALPSQALFWSAQNRAIYSFKGNCIMSLMQYANEITGIYGKWYNPATQELFLDTNIGILIFSDLGTYCLEWSTETDTKTVADIFFYEDRFMVNLVNDTAHTYLYSYNNLEGYTSNNIKLLTKYYGNGLVPITINNVYIRLYNQSVANAKGNIVFKGHTITDIGMQTDTKTVEIGGIDDPTAVPPEVAGEAWDSQTNTMLVKYTPQYNRGLGFSLEVETTFPIIDIKFDYVENGTIDSQVAHINI